MFQPKYAASKTAASFVMASDFKRLPVTDDAVTTPKPLYDSPDLPGSPFPEVGPAKKVLGMLISALSLALGLISMGMLRLPKVPVLSAPFFGAVFGAFALNEALAAAANAAKIPTIHHSESLRKIMTAPGYWFSKNVFEKAWPILFGGVQQKKAFIEKFARQNEAIVNGLAKNLVQNPMFEDLSLKLRDKRHFGEKASELCQSFGKVLIALAVGSVLPKGLRLTVGPWLTNVLGFPLMDRILQQFDQDPNTPGVQFAKPTDPHPRKSATPGVLALKPGEVAPGPAQVNLREKGKTVHTL